ncbi:PilN domain-containing protein [Salinispirillum sp. LH 10-3-1]|uniref:PilN domain-containing protein n=1 Tax=Salinispirillum sp. LH 10-3-1 TaxID=2952525 RepID=A0AB38YFQ5_9GAMM
MITVNLLPWREQARNQRKAEFIRVMLGVAVLSGVIIFAMDQYFRAETANQRARNDFIRAELRVMDEKIREINTLRSERTALLERMQVIQQLQGDRPIIVHVFDEMARVTPETVHYTAVTNTGGQIQITGVAEATGAISQLMRNFETSDWFTNPILGSVVSEPSGGATRHRFQLRVTQTTPSAGAGS